MLMGIANLGENMNAKDWISDPKVIEKSKKGYAHFDLRRDISKASGYVTNPDKVAHHGFYPFIHYVMKINKYNKQKGKKSKEREICYAAHIDRCIYQFYSAILNESYNLYLDKEGIDSVSVAYRTNLQKSNIHIAKEAFDYIRELGDAYVMIGDFTGFFDNLDHEYLKRQWCTVMRFDTLPEDHYAVFKNVTKYSTWELEDLLKITSLNLKEFNKRRIALDKTEYRKNRKHISKNTKSYQIPQGSPISAVLANIYMIDADKYVNEYVTSLGGIYRRYSDDFIVVIPKKDNTIFVMEQVINILRKTPRLQLEPNKTQIFEIQEQIIENVGDKLLSDADNSKKVINFLGFTFDGKNIMVRSKTIGKYYYRMYRKAKSISKNPHLEGKANLYKKYSVHGATAKVGNFFTYIMHAEDAFGEDELIYRDLKNHIPKIRRALNNSKK